MYGLIKELPSTVDTWTSNVPKRMAHAHFVGWLPRPQKHVNTMVIGAFSINDFFWQFCCILLGSRQNHGPGARFGGLKVIICILWRSRYPIVKTRLFRG